MKRLFLVFNLILLVPGILLYGQISEPWRSIGNIARTDSMYVEKRPDPLLLSKAYGYAIGKEIMAGRISKMYPVLELIAQKNFSRFMESWGMSIARIKFVLERYTKMPFQEFDSLLVGQMQPMLEAQELDFVSALEFINQLDTISKGQNIEASIFETLLAYRFPVAPNNEMHAGFSYLYDPGENPVARGLSFNLRLPVTWKTEAGISPNVVDMFISEQGRGQEAMVVIVVGDETLGELTGRDKEEFYEEENIKRLLPPGSKFDSMKQITLAGKPGLQVVFYNNPQVLDVSMYGKYIVYLTDYQNKIIFLSGSVFGEEEAEIEKRFQHFLPFFRNVAASLRFN